MIVRTVLRKFSSKQIFGKLCENGQGNMFKFHSKHHVDVQYLTFWNDFTYYTMYDKAPQSI